MMHNFPIRRGDIYFASNWCSWDPKQGRPVVVVSPDSHNSAKNFISVVPLSLSASFDEPTHIQVLSRSGPSAGLTERLTSIPKEYLNEFVRVCSDSEMQAIEKAILIALGIETEKHGLDDAPTIKDREVGNTTHQSPVLDEEKIQFRVERDIFQNLFSDLLNKVLLQREAG